MSHHFDSPTAIADGRINRADGAAASHGTKDTPLGRGRTGEVFPVGDGGLAWAGLAADPFTADGLALAKFLARQYLRRP